MCERPGFLFETSEPISEDAPATAQEDTKDVLQRGLRVKLGGRPPWPDHVACPIHSHRMGEGQSVSALTPRFADQVSNWHLKMLFSCWLSSRYR